MFNWVEIWWLSRPYHMIHILLHTHTLHLALISWNSVFTLLFALFCSLREMSWLVSCKMLHYVIQLVADFVCLPFGEAVGLSQLCSWKKLPAASENTAAEIDPKQLSCRLKTKWVKGTKTLLKTEGDLLSDNCLWVCDYKRWVCHLIYC